jgi:hypothetical protein
MSDEKRLSAHQVFRLFVQFSRADQDAFLRYCKEAERTNAIKKEIESLRDVLLLLDEHCMQLGTRLDDFDRRGKSKVAKRNELIVSLREGDNLSFAAIARNKEVAALSKPRKGKPRISADAIRRAYERHKKSL